MSTEKDGQERKTRSSEQKRQEILSNPKENQELNTKENAGDELILSWPRRNKASSIKTSVKKKTTRTHFLPKRKEREEETRSNLSHFDDHTIFTFHFEKKSR